MLEGQDSHCKGTALIFYHECNLFAEVCDVYVRVCVCVCVVVCVHAFVFVCMWVILFSPVLEKRER